MSSLAERVAALKADNERRFGKPDAEPEYDPAVIPEIEPVHRTPEDDDIDRILSDVDILDAYRRWCGKMEPHVGSGQRESVMVSCPNPAHPDKNPSAWINLDKDTYFCGGCQEGGDKFTIAGLKYGLDPKTQFPALRKQMAEDLGYTIRRTIGGATVAEPSTNGGGGATVEVPLAEWSQPSEALSAPLPSSTNPQPEAEAEEIDTSLYDDLCIPWRDFLSTDTFLGRWMETCSVSDLPEEYYFWEGLLALGLAVGHDAVLQDYPTVKANLFVCLFGPTGIGKSKAMVPLTELLEEALPFDPDDLSNKGALLAPIPGSPEAMIDLFSKKEYDPADPKKIVDYHEVRGLLRFNELSVLTERAARTGSDLKGQLMELYDAYHSIALRSRTAGYVKADHPFCSFVTSTQPDAIRDLVKDTDVVSGFLNRWVFAAGRFKPLRWMGNNKISVSHLVDPLRSIRSWASSGHREIIFSTDALTRSKEFFRKELEPLKMGGGPPLLSRMDLLLKKIMLLLTINNKNMMITEETVEQVEKLLPYLKLTYGMLDRGINQGGIFNECQDVIERHLKNHPEGMTPRDLQMNMPRRFARDLIMRSLKTMLEFKMVEEFRDGSDKRTKERYRLAKD